MFLARAGEKGKAFVTSFLGHEGIDAILSRLEDGAYDIVYSFALDQEQIVYEAFLQEPNHADPNAFFQTNIVLKCIRHRVSRDWVEPLPILGNDEYLVLRTRVVHDENGNIVAANYSRILGEFRANPSISTAESIFNPVPNDTNLEFDKKRNLYKGRGGRIISP